jgi:hypothetical protein
MKIESEKYGTIIQQYKKALIWLDQMGVKVGKGRLDCYKLFLEDFLVRYKIDKKDELNKLFPGAINTFYEVDSICSIFESLQTLKMDQIAGVKDKLAKAVCGPEAATDETARSNAARNFLFEVLVSSRLHNPSKGIIVDFASKTDTAATFLQKKYLIECKRLQSKENLENNVRKAANQLNKALRSKIGSNHRGIIALDISKIVNPSFKLLVAQNDRSLQSGLDGLIDSFINGYSHIWQNKLKQKNKKIVGVILRVSLMGVSEARNLLVTLVQWGMNPKITNSEFESLHLKELAHTIDYKQRLLFT